MTHFRSQVQSTLRTPFCMPLRIHHLSGCLVGGLSGRVSGHLSGLLSGPLTFPFSPYRTLSGPLLGTFSATIWGPQSGPDSLDPCLDTFLNFPFPTSYRTHSLNHCQDLYPDPFRVPSPVNSQDADLDAYQDA